jgi:hypothetical protein
MISKDMFLRRPSHRGGMANEEREVVPGLTAADIKKRWQIKVLNRTDGNRPQVNGAENGFEHFQNGKSDISSSPAFIRKIAL